MLRRCVALRSVASRQRAVSGGWRRRDDSSAARPHITRWRPHQGSRGHASAVSRSERRTVGFPAANDAHRKGTKVQEFIGQIDRPSWRDYREKDTSTWEAPSTPENTIILGSAPIRFLGFHLGDLITVPGGRMVRGGGAELDSSASKASQQWRKLLKQQLQFFCSSSAEETSKQL